MSLIIWQPRKYEAGFPKAQNNTYGYSAPIFPPVQAAPYDGDTLVREVARWRGWTQLYYADTGDFEATIEAGQVQPADIKLGYFVRIDDRHYQIEAIEWSKTEEGYSVVISGRSIERIFDDMYRQGIYAANGSNILLSRGYEQGELLCAGNPVRLWQAFGVPLLMIGMDADVVGLNNSALNFVPNDIPDNMSFISERDRMYGESSFIKFDLEQASLTDTAQNYSIQDAYTIGGAIRAICALYDVGYNLYLEYDEATRLHKVALRVYDKADNGVVITTNMQGVTDFNYSTSVRDEINTSIYRGVSRYYVLNPSQPPTEKAQYSNYASKASTAHFANWSEMANLLSCRYVDKGEIEEESDTGVQAVQQYLLANAEPDDLVDRTADISFTYDNTGQYKYGRDFSLGSKVYIADEYIGIGATQTLTGVKTRYNEGAVKEYEFTFGKKAITSADKLLKKFSQLNSRGFIMDVRS